MKKFLLCCLLAVLGCGLATLSAKEPAKKKEKGQITTTVFMTDIHCEGCANRILNNVPMLGKGVKDVQVDVPTKEVTVTYDAAKTSPEKLVEGFAKVRVKAEVKPQQ